MSISPGKTLSFKDVKFKLHLISARKLWLTILWNDPPQTNKFIAYKLEYLNVQGIVLNIRTSKNFLPVSISIAYIFYKISK